MDSQSFSLKRILAWILLMTLFVGGTVGFTWPWLGYQIPLPDLFPTPEATSPAWEKAKARLAETELRSAKAVKQRIDALKEWFRERSNGCGPFAEEVLSLSGKWALVKTTLRIDDAHGKFLAEKFNEYIFTSEDLRQALEATVNGYLTDLDALENDLLVKLQADLADDELARGQLAVHLRSEAAFRQEVERIAKDLVPALGIDLGVGTGRMVGMIGPANLAGNFASAIVMQISTAVASRLGISTTFYGAGVLSSGATLGVSFAVGWALDALLQQLLQMFGYCPEYEVRSKVMDALEMMQRHIIDGSHGAKGDYQQLTKMAKFDGMASVREASARAILRMKKGGHLGLQWELENVHETRSLLRKTALRKLLLEGGTP